MVEISDSSKYVQMILRKNILFYKVYAYFSEEHVL